MKALVVCPEIKQQRGMRSPQSRLEEAASLCHAIALEVVEALSIIVSDVKPATVIGAGQLSRIASLAQEHEAGLAVFDTALTPMQQRNLEKALGIKVIDRSALILEIFGERAQTREGKLQVELAALEYQKSRLVRSWTHLERQRGGFGFMGGPGESQIETDRRLIRDRIALIRRQLDTVVRTRSLHRQVRRDVPYPTIALIGYTNAGKSTLFNRLTSAGVLAEDALFATLDPTTRRMRLPCGMEVLVSDTVGFVSNLPTQLIAAFRATLEEVRQAHLLLHVRDIVHEDTRAQRDDVLGVIRELFDQADDVPPMIEVWNKADLADEEMQQNLNRYTANPVAISAVTGEGVPHLLRSIEGMLTEQFYQSTYIDLPLSDGEALAWVYRHGIVRSTTTDEACGMLHVHALLSPADQERFSQLYGIAVQGQQRDLLESHKG